MDLSIQLPHNVGETKLFSVDAASDTTKSCWNYVSIMYGVCPCNIIVKEY